MHDQDARDAVARVEALLEEVDSLADPAARDKATECVAALLDLYGEGLARIVEQVSERDSDGMAEAFAGDELIAHLLLLHGLHPIPLEARVRGALEEVTPYLESHGGGVELVGVDGGVARLRLQGSCSGCPSSTMTLKLAIEDAIQKAAPDIEGIDAEGVSETESSLLQITVSDPSATNGASGAEPAGDAGEAEPWTMAGGLPELSSGGKLLKQVAGEPVLFLKLQTDLYAYRPGCPGCHESLEDAELRAVELTCASCGHRYDVIRAGRCLDAPELYLEPVPLLVDDSGLAKVALGSAVG